MSNATPLSRTSRPVAGLGSAFLPVRSRAGALGLLAFLCALAAPQARAQTATLKGFVTDRTDGNPLELVNVVLEGEGGEARGGGDQPRGVVPRRPPPAGAVRAPGLVYRVRDLRGHPPPRGGRGAHALDHPRPRRGRPRRGAGRVGADRGGRPHHGRTSDDPPRERSSGSPPRTPRATWPATSRRCPASSRRGTRGGSSLSAGGEPSQNLVLFDGMTLYQPFHVLGFYSAFPSSVLNKADIYAGGFGARYGGRLSSVIDVDSRNGNNRRFAGGASLSPFISEVRLEGPIVPGKVSFIGSARQSFVEEGGRAARRRADAVPVRRRLLQAPRDPVGEQPPLRQRDRHLRPGRARRRPRRRRGRGGPLAEPRHRPPLPHHAPPLARPRRPPPLLQRPRDRARRRGRPRPPFLHRRHPPLARTPPSSASASTSRPASPSASSPSTASWAGSTRTSSSPSPRPTSSPTTSSRSSSSAAGSASSPASACSSTTSASTPTSSRACGSCGERGAHQLSAAAGIYYQELVGLSDRRDASSVFTAWSVIPKAGPRVEDVRAGRVPRARHAILGYRTTPAPLARARRRGVLQASRQPRRSRVDGVPPPHEPAPARPGPLLRLRRPPRAPGRGRSTATSTTASPRRGTRRSRPRSSSGTARRA